MKVFVYGSNEQGLHGAGSAKEATLKHGAIRGRNKLRCARMSLQKMLNGPDA
jgi:hypothetical protein